MKIHRLLLENFRGVVRREIVFPDHGLIVVSGPNEVGKSSLIEALDLLLEEKDSAAKAAVRVVKPVRADVGSVIDAEISTGPYRFRYRKQFHRNTATTLTITAPVAEQLTGTPAHERVRRMLAETLDEKLYKALRLMQATPLGQTELADSAALATALDLAAGAAGNPADGESLIAAAHRAFRLDHTPGGRPSGEFKAADEELAVAERAAQRTAAGLAEIGVELDRFSEALNRRDHAQHVLRRSGAELTQARTWKEHEQRHREAVDRAARAAQAAVADRDRVRAGQEQRLDLIVALDRRQAELADLARRDEEHLRAVADRRRRMDEQAAVVAGCVEQERGAAIAATQARARVDRHRTTVELAGLEDRLEQIGVAVAELARHRDNAAAGIDAARMHELLEAAAAVEAAYRDQRAGSPMVSVSAPPGAAVWVGRARHPAEQFVSAASVSAASVSAASVSAASVSAASVSAASVSAESVFDASVFDASVDYPVTEDLTITTAEGVTVTIRPARTAAALTSAVEHAQAHQRALLAAAGVPDLPMARLRHDDHRAAAAAAERVGGALAARLGSDSIEVLTARRDALRVEVRQAPADDIASGGPDPGHADGSGPGDAVAATGPKQPDRPAAALLVARSAADAAAITAAARAAEAVQTLDRRREEFQQATLHAARTTGTMAALTTEMQHWAGELAAARAGCADAEWEAAVAGAERSVAETQQLVTEMQLVSEQRAATETLRQVATIASPGARLSGTATNGAIRTDPSVAAGDLVADSAARFAAAETALAAAQRESVDSATAVAEIQGRLDAIGGQGRQDEHDRAQSALAAARRRHVRIGRRAAAARLLFQTLTEHRDRARESYVAPFAEQLTRLGAAVFGVGVRFEVAPDLTVVRRTLDGTTVAFEQLSTGAREQLAVLIRLAAARLVADVDRVPIFLDDALGYADPDRLAGLGAAFGLAAEHAQLILLTCDPQRLRDLPGAQVIALTRADGDGEISAARPVPAPTFPAPRAARPRPAGSAPIDPRQPVPVAIPVPAANPVPTVPALFDAPPGHEAHRSSRPSRARGAHRPRTPAGS